LFSTSFYKVSILEKILPQSLNYSFFLLLFFPFFIIVLGGYIVILQKFLQYIIVEFTLFIILLYVPSPQFPLLEQFQQFTFFYLYTCVHSIFTIFFIHPFPTSSLLPLVLIPQTGTVFPSCSAILYKKKDIFVCLR
jgi:hypothetical protein